MTEQINSKMSTLSSLFSNSKKFYEIPEFQREFVWTDVEVQQLFLDFAEDSGNYQIDTSRLSGYLLGNIVLIKDSNDDNKYSVVDGQQRLTTISLIYKAIQLKGMEILSDPNVREKNIDLTEVSDMISTALKSYSLVDDFGQFRSFRILHNSQYTFGTIYKDILHYSIKANKGDKNKDENTQHVDTIELKPNSTKSDQNILDVWDEINDQLESFSYTDLIRFRHYLDSRVYLIKTTAPSESKAFQLFEVLNDRGKSLEPLDLIKNLFLKRLDQDGMNDDGKYDFNQSWSRFLNNLQSPKKKISSSTFMKQFILMKYGKNLNKDELFDFFNKKQLRNNSNDHVEKNEGFDLHGEDIKIFVHELENKSSFYSEIEKHPDSNDFVGKNETLKEYMFILFKLFKIKQFHPLIMLYYSATDNDKEQILNSALRLGLSTIYSFQQTNAIESKLPTIIKRYYDSKKDEQTEQIINVMGKLSDDYVPILRATLQNRDLKNQKAKALLRFIEIYVNHNTSAMNDPRGNNHIELEHILPQDTSRRSQEEKESLGFSEDDDIRQVLNRIGNLTLLTKSENSSISDQIFKKKIVSYQNSGFKVTKSIVSNIPAPSQSGIGKRQTDIVNYYEKNYVLLRHPDAWGKDMIEERTNDIIDLIINIIQNKVKSM